MRCARANHRCRSAFTLVEMLVVVGIILVLAALLLPALYKSRIQMDRQRTLGDEQVIANGLEAYRQDSGDFPRTTTDASILLGPFLVGKITASANLYTFTAGYQMHSGGRTFGPYLQAQAIASTGNGTDSVAINNSGLKIDVSGHILDHNSYPIQYLPAHPKPSPDPMVAGGFVAAGTGSVWNTANQTVLTAAQISVMLGDTNFNGQLDAGETAAYSGPFILWSCGPDGVWGPPSPFTPAGVAACDDVLNFR